MFQCLKAIINFNDSTIFSQFNDCSFFDSESTIDFSEAAGKLANGLLSIYQPPLEQVKKELFELT